MYNAANSYSTTKVNHFVSKIFTSHTNHQLTKTISEFSLISLLSIAAVLTNSKVLNASEINANIFIANNYVFRGLTRTKDQPTVQGGVQYLHDTGLYAGLHISNVDFRPGAGRSQASVYADNETIYTLGYTIESREISYLIGITAYEYPSGGGARFSEINGDIGYKGLKLSLNYDDEHENLYSRLSYQLDFNERLHWLVHIGKYSLNEPAGLVLRPEPLFDNDYTDILIGFNYQLEDDFTWSFSFIDTNLDTDDTDEYSRFVISLEKSFGIN